MNLYKIEQDIYDTKSYKSVIVRAETEDQARTIHPEEDIFLSGNKWFCKGNSGVYQVGPCGWVYSKQLQKIKVTLIGIALKGCRVGVVSASYIEDCNTNSPRRK